MAQSAMNWDIAPEGGRTEPSDHRSPTVAWPTILPVNKPRAIRRVGTIKTLAPRKNLGLLIDENGGADALFTFEDIVEADRQRLTVGQTVTYIAVIGCDGVEAKQIRQDQTTLPPLPPESLFSKGWR